MTKINLNDLPQWSPWPSRLLGVTPWETQVRTIEKIEQEYNKDKYAQCLADCIRDGVEATLTRPYGLDPLTTICVALKNDLVLMTLAEARTKFYKLLLDTMRQDIEESATVVELGCGFGYNLWFLERFFHAARFLGGDYSENAVLLAEMLSINVSQFNFYDSSYDILEEAQPPITIFTVHAIEQLPKAAPCVQALLRYRDKIKKVFHFEPLCELHDYTLLGLMRRRYVEVNDYNRDLLSELQLEARVKILRIEPHVIGLNPLNPTSVIEWEFK